MFYWTSETCILVSISEKFTGTIQLTGAMSSNTMMCIMVEKDNITNLNKTIQKQFICNHKPFTLSDIIDHCATTEGQFIYALN